MATQIPVSHDDSRLGASLESHESLRGIVDNAMVHFRPDEFNGRLGLLRDITSGYDGALADTWEASQAGHVQTLNGSRKSPGELSNQAQWSIVELARRVKNSGATRVVIEAAHIYADEDLADPATRSNLSAQASYGAFLAGVLKEIGGGEITTSEVLFIDDYNAAAETPENLDELKQDLIELTRRAGYDPGLLLHESDMHTLASAMLLTMDREQGIVRAESPDGLDVFAEAGEFDFSTKLQKFDLYLSRKRVELWRAGDRKITCAMLDAALSVLKMHYLGSAVVNILPISCDSHGFTYRGQQRNMRRIVSEHTGSRVVPIFNIFVPEATPEKIRYGAPSQLRKLYK